MGTNVNIQGYLDNIKAPWGKLLYKMVWHGIECEGKRILDFGSGFGVTADHFAASNEVIAVEPIHEMLEYRINNQMYVQIEGGIEQLKQMESQSFDLILCHNVLEYVENRSELIQEFARLLKPDGILSVVKHNKAGKIMQKAVLEYKIDEALALIHDGNLVSPNFGVIREYEDSDLEEYGGGAFQTEQIYGIRTFFALQRNELKTGPEWLSKMFELECAVEEVPEFRNIAFFHHVIMRLK